MSSRRAARRTALFLLYQWDLTGQPLASLYEGEIDPFALELAQGVVEQADELDRGEVPVEVAIDEAVTLAKRYASEDAGRLVNGILGRLAREAA